MKWDFILHTVSYIGRLSTGLRTRFIIEIQIQDLGLACQCIQSNM